MKGKKEAVTKRAGDDHALPANAAATLERLEIADLLRLEILARLHVRGMPHVEWRDLLHTAIERVIAGTRKWPRNVPFVAFMASVMRSIANELWAQHYRTREAGIYLEADLPVHDADKDGIIGRAASNVPEPERELLAKHELDKIEAVFIDDEHALAPWRG